MPETAGGPEQSSQRECDPRKSGRLLRLRLQPVFCDGPDGRRAIPTRRAIVREDTGQAIAVVSDRYALVPHTRILDVVEQAIRPLDVGPVPRGIYVDRQGARMRAALQVPSARQSGPRAETKSVHASKSGTPTTAPPGSPFTSEPSDSSAPTWLLEAEESSPAASSQSMPARFPSRGWPTSSRPT